MVSGWLLIETKPKLHLKPVYEAKHHRDQVKVVSESKIWAPVATLTWSQCVLECKRTRSCNFDLVSMVSTIMGCWVKPFLDKTSETEMPG